MFVHDYKLNPCKCGFSNKPTLDSDVMIPCWAVECTACHQFQHDENWTLNGAIKVWNDANPIIQTQ